MKHSWLERVPLATGVIRDGRLVFVNHALVELTGAPREALVGTEFLAWVVPADRDRMRDRHARRLRGEHVPGSYEFTLLRGDGASRICEAWVAIAEEGDVVFQLHDRTDRAARRDKLDRLARLGAAVQNEQSAEGIFAALGRGLDELDLAMVRFAPDRADAPQGLRVLSASAPGDRLARFEAALGRGLADLAGIWGPAGEAAWREGSAYVDDMPLAGARCFAPEPSELDLAALRSVFFARGVMIRTDLAGRPEELLLLTADWLLPEDLPACRLFGAQVAAAQDAARIIRDQQIQNAALAAQNRIAGYARTAASLDELFARGAAEIVELVGCHAVAVYLIDDVHDEGLLAYVRGGTQEAAVSLARVPLAGTQIGEVARAGVPRVLRRDDYDESLRALLDRMGQRVIASVPLCTRGRVLGVMNVAYADDREVAPREIEVMGAAGAHFAAAVEAERLVTDLRRSYADLARAQEQLVERERLAAIGELSAVVAHEVRNPLGVLFNSLGALRKLLGDAAEGSARTLLEIMEEEAARLNHIVGDLLDFARPTTPTLSRERLDLVLDEAVTAALGEARGRLVVVRRIHEDLPAPMDARLIRQALVNLVDNAVHAMPAAGTLVVRLAPEEIDGVRMARIDLEDTGPGIAPDVEPRIFEPFFTTRASGTGLGLAVVKRIVDGHRGKLQVSSGEGRGATFSMWLPLDEAPPSRR